MSIWLLVALLVTQTGQSVWRPPVEGADDVQSFIASVETALNQRDRSALERALGDDFQFIHSTGRIEERASFVQRAAAGQLASQRIPATTLDAQIRMYGDTAVRITRVSVRTDTANASAPSTEIYTSE